MRFPLLKLGQKFIFQGKRYSKTGPVTASEEGSGKQCMIRRSAEVTPVDDHVERQDQFERDQVVTLLKAYQRELKARLADVMGAEQTLDAADVLKTVDGCDVVAFLAQLNRPETL